MNNFELNIENNIITSVKRLSDGEIFKVGDKVISAYGENFNITKFRFEYYNAGLNILACSDDNNSYLSRYVQDIQQNNKIRFIILETLSLDGESVYHHAGLTKTSDKIKSVLHVPTDTVIYNNSIFYSKYSNYLYNITNIFFKGDKLYLDGNLLNSDISYSTEFDKEFIIGPKANNDLRRITNIEYRNDKFKILEIQSIKDNRKFKIGDEFLYASDKYKITSFTEIFINAEDSAGTIVTFSLYELDEFKLKIGTSYDDINIYEGDSVYHVKNDNYQYPYCGYYASELTNTDYLYFANGFNVQKFRKHKSRLFSRADIDAVLNEFLTSFATPSLFKRIHDKLDEIQNNNKL